MSFVRSFLVLVFIYLSVGAAAHAEGTFVSEPQAMLEEVMTPNLILAGRGFENRKTHETMALSCVDQGETACGTLRFIYVNSVTQKAYYLGPVFNVSVLLSELSQKKQNHLTDAQEREYAIKYVMKTFKKWNRKNHGRSKEAQSNLQALSFVVVVAMGGVASLVGGPIGLAVGLCSYPFYILFAPLIAGDLKLMSGNQKITSASYDQNGWNWSSDPVSIRNKVFNQLFRYLAGTAADAGSARLGASL